MESLYEGRVGLKVADSVVGAWALPTWEHVSVGRLPGAGIHIPDSWVPARLCRFLPYERGWLVQLGHARGRVVNKYLGDLIFRGRTVVALQPGKSLVTFPELDDHVRLAVTIGADQAQGLPMAEDQRGLEDEVRHTAYAAARVEFTDEQRRLLAVTFEHLLKRQPAPANVATTAAAKLGKNPGAVKVALGKAREKVNEERWLNLETNEQLGHYLVHLSRNLTEADLPLEFQGDG